MAIETIVPPHSPVYVQNEDASGMWQVTTPRYPSSEACYIDSRFLTPAPDAYTAPRAPLPSPETILTILRSLAGTRYFWGGNWPQGIPDLLLFYPEAQDATADDRLDFLCEGVDCSGLVYYATDGNVPRNTSDMVSYGTAIEHSGLLVADIQKIVRPLDWVVWRGHVITLLSQDEVIESRIGRGVSISPFAERFEEALCQTRAQGKELFIRRWHPEML
jgi:cell wall-associated NlpC family hydrolase